MRYAAACFTGRVRKNNEDNWLLEGGILPERNDGRAGILTGEASLRRWRVSAVFDGMGGAARGELAAWTAADAMARRREAAGEEALGPRWRSRLEAMCREVNRAVCRAAAEQRAPGMGATLAAAMGDGEWLYALNLGDSRVYEWRQGSLRCLSVDHTAWVPRGGKPPLSQCLGIPEAEFLVEPHAVRLSLGPPRQLLLCTDGLTDMLSDAQIASVLGMDAAPKDKARALSEAVMARGAIDNTTMILLDMGGL